MEHGAQPDEKALGGKAALLVVAGRRNIQMTRLPMDWGADSHQGYAAEMPTLRLGSDSQHDKHQLLNMTLSWKAEACTFACFRHRIYPTNIHTNS